MDHKEDRKSSAISSSTPSFCFRYNPEDEQIEQLFYDTSEQGKKDDYASPPSKKQDSSETIKPKQSSPSLSSSRSTSVEERFSPERWKIFNDIKGRITKKVEEKLEEIKSDVNKVNNEETEQPSNLSLSDSDDTDPMYSVKDCLGDHPFTDSHTVSSQLTKTQVQSTRMSRIEFGLEAVEEMSGNEVTRLQPMEDTAIATTAQEHASASSFRAKLLPANLSLRASVYFALIAVFYIFVTIPQFLFGIVVGVVLSLELRAWVDCWSQEPIAHTDITLHQSVISSQHQDTDNLTYQGWMNEFCYEYKPEIYHVSQTETVYVKLERNILKLASPRRKISKRALWNEADYKVSYDRERTYDISNCQVLLLPEKLAHKRLWSKKYPICISIGCDSHLGTRYRERGTPSLDLHSLYSQNSRTKKMKGNDLKEEIEESHEETKDGTKLEEAEKKEGQVGMSSDEEEEMVMCSSDDEEYGGDPCDFVHIPKSLINKNNIYLFARTDRDKDIWFRRFTEAVKFKTDCDMAGSQTERNVDDEALEGHPIKVETLQEHYQYFMSRLFGKNMIFFGIDKTLHLSEEEDEHVIWFNLFLGRILYDPIHDPYWLGLLQDKIQKKLSAIKIPAFMEGLLVSQVELSESIPLIRKTTLPTFNNDGIWVDHDITYNGTFKMTIDTKINLIKLKKYHGTDMAKGDQSPQSDLSAVLNPAIFDSEIEDSAESSCDEYDSEDYANKMPQKTNTSQKVLQMVDKIASSKYFQQVTDNKYVKKALQGVSNTTISLLVEVKSLTGTIVLNFPPPPSDRLWYAFRPNTKLCISAKPKVGQRGINMTYITNYIEKKLLLEFQKLLVMPNMDDLIIPIMNKEKAC